MKIMICSPVSIDLLSDYIDNNTDIPKSYSYPLAAYLVQLYLSKGHHVDIVTSTTGATTPLLLSGKNLRIFVTPRRKHYLFCVDAYRKEVRQMVKAIKTAQPDIVHAQWTYEFAYAAIKSGYPCCVTAHDNPVKILSIMRTPYRLLNLCYSLCILPRIRYMTFVSPYLRDSYRRLYKNVDRSVVIPNGLKAEFFIDTPKKRQSSFSCVFASLSSINRRKNAKTALHAFRILSCNHSGVRLVFIGSGLVPGCSLHRYAVENGLSERVSFLGVLKHTECIRFLQHEADVLVHTSFEESFGMTILEAMACGIPVIGGEKSGAVPWLLDNGKAGLLCDVTNPASVANAMERMLTDTDYANRLAVAGLERSRNIFSLECVANQYIDYYRSILNAV